MEHESTSSTPAKENPNSLQTITPPSIPSPSILITSPAKSPGTKYGRSPANETYGDRFIPTRTTSNLQRNLFGGKEEVPPNSQISLSNSPQRTPQFNANFAFNNNHQSPPTNAQHHNHIHSSNMNNFHGMESGMRDEQQLSTYNMILKNELNLAGSEEIAQFSVHSSSNSRNAGVLATSPPKPNILKYKTVKQTEKKDSPFSLSPISDESQKLLSSPRKPLRKVPKDPFKILEAPSIQDDFYLNLVDWSSQNLLAVGLSNSVFLWNASTSHVTLLCDVGDADSITAVSWVEGGNYLAVGTNTGLVQIWDVSQKKKVREMIGHKARVGSLAWNSHTLSSGSRDHFILNRDVRDKAHYSSKLVGHKQEVCGLKWSSDGSQLASGGNDNKLLVWDVTSNSPLLRFSDHTAAVKAIAWSPHQRGLLASGGGTADRCIRFWNTIAGVPVNHYDTGSQVCNLAWSKNVNELVSTHGYSQNQVVVWSYPSMSQIATLTGHTMRVLYLSVSPDGQNVVTGAGDETLRFWNVFPSAKSTTFGKSSSSLQFKNDIR
eukprot:TRINITY_DN5436_c0_g1_i1.p1 TRINITY_DN5436_c0_g1~~TRINITY_DN5436_c0_g1_i1.p1  ORF type:complete len:546 (+),score=114.24 TRINITY_DN5436_c0_g1_i1:232-1869(+)